MFLDSGNTLDDDSLVLDFGTISDLPSKVMRGTSSREIFLREAWEILELGTHLRFLRKHNDNEKLKPFWLTYEEVIRSIQEYSTYFWLPYGFNDVDHATIAAMNKFSVLVLDIDSDVDLMFWKRTRDQIIRWIAGETLFGIPAPTMICFSGNGIHPYWKMFPFTINKRMKHVAKVIHYVFRCKLSMFYTRKPLHKLNFNQSYRIPESMTKAGDVCKAFVLDNGFNGSFEDLIRCSVTVDEATLLLEYIDGQHSVEELIAIQSKYGILSGIEKPEKEKQPSEETENCIECTVERELGPNETDIFNQAIISKYAEIIDADSATIKKNFAKRVVFALRCQSPISEGNRTLRMLGLAIALSPHKAGTSHESMIKLVNLANDQFCNPPLMNYEIANICKDPDQYKYCSERRLKEFLGIKNWPVFIKRETTMTRQEAGKNAAVITQHRCMQKLVKSYLELGFGANISLICNHAQISRQTFFRYRDSGILRAVFNWFIECGNLDHNALSQLRRHLFRFKNDLGRLDETESNKIKEFLLNIQINSLS